MVREVGIVSSREPQVRRDAGTGLIRLILCGMRDARSSVDRHTRPRIVLPAARAARLRQQHIIQLAQSWLGVPYLFGGCSHGGVDCSCLVQNVYAAVGIHLPRVAVDQFNATSAVADPEPGDLVFFANTYQPGISHVGIYIGDGLQINAPTTGQVVSIVPVFTGYWGAHYTGAHRVRT
jgi:cell wall-associated NlpC family hydrolase